MRSYTLNRTLTWTLLLALMFIPAWALLAQEAAVDDSAMGDSGIYFSAGGGLAMFAEIGKAKGGIWLEKDGEPFYYDDSGTKKDGTPSLTEGDYDASFDIGWTAGGAIGYRFGAVRVEAEGSYHSANFKGFGTSEIDKDSYDTLPNITVLALMANGWYEFDTGTIFAPFVGLGAGAVQGTTSSGLPKNAPDSFEATVFSGWGFAYQGAAGVGINVAGGLSIQLRYRLLGTLETTYTNEETSSDALAFFPGSPDKVVSAIAFPLLAHRIELGMRYQL